MSKKTSAAGGQAVAQLVSGLTSEAIRSTASDTIEATMIGLSAAVPAVMIVAGLLSKKFSESTAKPTPHPGACADQNSILYAALLLARAASPVGDGCGIAVSPDIYAEAIADFGKLCPLVSVDTFLRADFVAASCDTGSVDVAGLVNGILAKKPASDSIN